MPTWIGMFSRRAPVTLCVAIACALAPVAAGAVTTTTVPTTVAPVSTTAPPTTTTTIPPPPTPAFALPTNFGLQLIQTQQTAQHDLAVARLELPGAQKRVATAERDDRRAQAQLKKLRADARDNERKLDETRRNLGIAAARAYMHADGGQLAAAIATLTSASSAVDVASQLHLINRYGSNARA